MTQYVFEQELRINLKWNMVDVSFEEYAMLIDVASYMTNEERKMFFEIIQRMMTKVS